MLKVHLSHEELGTQMHTLIICEKPDAAARIARALDQDRAPHRTIVQGVPIFHCSTNDGTANVCSALGHLYSITSKGNSPRRYYPVWDYEWAPRCDIERKMSAKLYRWIKVIETLSRSADRFVNACDYDVEGAVIGFTLLRYACGKVDSRSQRMKFSTMTSDELENAYTHLEPILDYGMINAGLCRHEMDWLYGINLSRFLTQSSLKNGGGYTNLSSGRVQCPTLQFVISREREINSFQPTAYWRINVSIIISGQKYDLEYEQNPLSSQHEAKKGLNAITNGNLNVASIQSEKITIRPPYPFDLSTLQSEAFRIFRYTPSKTLAIAEKLYLNALISYPRTNSQKLPASVSYATIIRNLQKNGKYRHLTSKLLTLSKLEPNQGPNSDPAHPAIYPTGNGSPPSLSSEYGKILDLIIRRFLSTFANESLQEDLKITFEKDSHRFFLNGTSSIHLGWREYYEPYVREVSKPVPSLKIQETVPIDRAEVEEKFTQPPPRYNPASLLRKMETENIGTKATRSEIIDILYQRSYIQDIQIRPTTLGMALGTLLEEYCPSILEPNFTAKLDDEMLNIEHGKTEKKLVLLSALEHLRPLMLKLAENEKKVGSQVARVVHHQKTAAISFASKCPQCTSVLRIVRNRSTGKRFIGCTGWLNGCRYKLPLPPYGILRILPTTCSNCKFQLVEVRNRGRRPFRSCPRCYANKHHYSNEDSRTPVAL